GELRGGHRGGDAVAGGGALGDGDQVEDAQGDGHVGSPYAVEGAGGRSPHPQADPAALCPDVTEVLRSVTDHQAPAGRRRNDDDDNVPPSPPSLPLTPRYEPRPMCHTSH